MNMFQIVITQLIALLSLLIASGVLIHDTNLDKAFSSAAHQTVAKDMTDTNANLRPGGQPHTHAEHLNVKDRGDNAKVVPRRRDKKHIAPKRVVRGYHGNGICMPLAGEWV